MFAAVLQCCKQQWSALLGTVAWMIRRIARQPVLELPVIQPLHGTMQENTKVLLATSGTLGANILVPGLNSKKFASRVSSSAQYNGALNR